MKHIADQIVKITNQYLGLLLYIIILFKVTYIFNYFIEAKYGRKLNESQETGLRSLIVDISSKDILENSVYKLLC